MLSDEVERILRAGGFVVGEYTTGTGPFEDDHFVVLVSPSEDQFEFPAASSKAAVLRHEIGRLYGTEPRYVLSAITNPASAVLFPAELRGANLYDLTPVRLSWWRRLLYDKYVMVLSGDVLEYLRMRRGELGPP